MAPEKRRCAIYTRKSSEEGLEQDFNSLAAQREACEAYIASQRGDGWIALPEQYDDGGFSGGTLERPALQRLLVAIDAGQVDIVVVYKVDRLTRSLSDFSKLIERFDAHTVSVVAVTQPFNTTTSMGRLTLNMLLSFAQFEREITGERIRDKIAASKRKGMWMGGCVPLGYDLGDRVLIVNDTEAAVVREIFTRYLALGSVRSLQQALESDRIRSKVRISRNGNRTGNNPFSRGALYALLANRLYIGEISHQGQHHVGLHEAIIDRALFDAVQAKLIAHRHGMGPSGATTSLLAGKVFDGDGHRLTPSHANKRGKRYRYYVSRRILHGGASETRARWPAYELEAFVRAALVERLRDPINLLEDRDTGTVEFTDRAAKLSKTIACDGVGDATFVDLIASMVLTDSDCTIALDRAAVYRGLDLSSDVRLNVTWTVPLTVRTCQNGQKRIVHADAPSEPDRALITAMVDAHRWYRSLVQGDVDGITALARQYGRDVRYVKRLLGLVYLAPDIKLAILNGTQPPDMTVQALTKTETLPVAFDDQRRRWEIG